MLDSLSFSVNKGDRIALTGRNGSGKTTMLLLAAGLLRPSSGNVLLFGENPASSAAARRRIGYLGHELGHYDELTALENLRFHARIFGIRPSDGELLNALSSVELEDRGDDLVASFSRGMKERLGIARITLHDPELLLLDEPTSGLDDRWNFLLKALEGRTVIASTHDHQFISAAKMSVFKL